MINLHERMLQTRRGSNPQPPDHQSDAHPTEPPRQVNPVIVEQILRMQKFSNTPVCFLRKIRKKYFIILLPLLS